MRNFIPVQYFCKFRDTGIFQYDISLIFSSRDFCRASLEVSRESVESSRESVEVGRESVESGRELVESQ